MYTRVTQIDFSGFESGTQGWTFGGSDGDRSNKRSNVDDSGVLGGTWSAHLQDDSSTSEFLKNFDFAGGYSHVNISFGYYPKSIDNNEYVQLLCDGVEVWRFTKGAHGQNAWFSTKVKVEITDCNFDSSVEIKFEGNPGLSGNSDDIWVDGINITGIL
jgi:hypothetical protein|tara:strand:- start:10 stop:483 length:474 start_codon:yes stop_codon:yes gene_type:complete